MVAVSQLPDLGVSRRWLGNLVQRSILSRAGVYEYTWNQVKHHPDYVERTLTERPDTAGWRR